MSNLLKMFARGGAVSAPSDADFENVTLLLHGDGTNGAQNNTFLDSSTNNFTITRNGNATQGTFTPFSKVDGRWGNYFDGSNDNLSVAANSAFLYTGDFTVEMWVYPTRFVDFEFLFGTGGSGTQDQANIYANGTYVYFDGTNSVTSPTLNLNAWNHIAVTRSGTTIRAYANGVSGTSQTKSGNLGSSANAFRIGERSDGAQDFNGYISNLRVVNGTAVYTGSTYTIPTTPLTNITNTSLLTCQSNRFKDNSSNNFAITANGNVKVTPFSPFPTLTAYDAATNGGSGYFDGSGDYLVTGATSIGSNNFTVEFWMYPTEVSGGYTYPAYTGSGGSRASGIYFEYNYLSIMTIGYNDAFLFYQNIGTIVAGAWNHIAVTRNGSTWKGFVNGVQGFSVTNAGTLDTFNQFIIGSGVTSGDFKGYVSSFREVVGTSLYNSAFTPPTAPLTAVANTELLCNFTNAGILDNSMSNNLTTVGNAQIDTTTKKYGTGSIEFDGTGDYLVAPDINNFILSGPFTIEAWVYRNTSSSRVILIEGRTAGGYYNYLVGVLPDGTIEFVTANSGDFYGTTETVTHGQWVHVALVRDSSNVCKFYIDGVGVSTTKTISGTLTPAASSVWIGGQRDPHYTNGFIDDLRITKGIARYTSNFTPPTAALPDIGA